MSTKRFFLGLGLSLAACVRLHAQSPPDGFPKDLALPVSIINLIASPERYDRQLVYVSGWVSVGYHVQALHFSSERRQFGSGPDAIWLEFSESFLEHTDPRTLDGRFVFVKGVFDKTRHGEMGLYPGSVTRIEEVIVPAVPDSTQPAPSAPTPCDNSRGVAGDLDGPGR